MNEATFLDALHENPGDEVTWLALADFLDEAGQADRAELVRLVRRLRTLPVMKRTKEKAALEDRVAALLNGGTRPVVPEVVNSIGMRFALIPPGRFRMGSPEDEPGRDEDDQPAHEVTLTRPYYLGVFPVTQKQYGVAPSDYVGDAGQNVDDFPAEQVSRDDATEFCRLLALREGGSRPGVSYRLPTEAEWEYACRGGSASSTAFHCGPWLSRERANIDLWEGTGTQKGPCAVGSYRPNVFGLYDMHGMVWEWCADRLATEVSGPVTDPVGPPTDRPVCRGGSWAYGTSVCRAASRSPTASTTRGRILGFRIVYVPPS